MYMPVSSLRLESGPLREAYCLMLLGDSVTTGLGVWGWEARADWGVSKLGAPLLGAPVIRVTIHIYIYAYVWVHFGPPIYEP